MRLEPDEGKLSCPVLRGGSGSNVASLPDEIAFAQHYERPVAAESFQHWKLSVNPDHTALLTCDDGNGQEVFSKSIPYSDSPLDEISLYFTHHVILLPSEY